MEQKVSISKTKVYTLFQALEKKLEENPKAYKEELDALEEEIMLLAVAHSIFIFTIRGLYLKMKECGVEKETPIVFKEQKDLIEEIIRKVNILNDYYYKNKE